MTGLELSRAYYEEYGKTMLEKDFPEVLKYLAVGSVGSGSDRYGFDDEISRDHDFEPGFCIFLPDESIVSRRDAFLLERAYAGLPEEFMGFRRQKVLPVGGSRNGVIRTADFYLSAVGSPDGSLSDDAWLHIPDYALAEAINGEVFSDEYGEFTGIRNSLRKMPKDILCKRLAGNLLLMAQAGQYNFLRCIRHGEPEAAQLACTEFINAGMKAVFLLNGKYMPYYKWCFRALRKIDPGKFFSERFSVLLCGDNREENVVSRKNTAIGEIASQIIFLLRERNLTDAVSRELEEHAYSVNNKIADSVIRNMHILSAI